jgi:hypothetical protein
VDLKEQRIQDVMDIFDWCESEGLHPIVDRRSGRVVISSGGIVAEHEWEIEDYGHEFIERASVWAPFTNELYELNKTAKGRSILLEAYYRWLEGE